MERPTGTPRRQETPQSDGRADTSRPTAADPRTPHEDHCTMGTRTPQTPLRPPDEATGQPFVDHNAIRELGSTELDGDLAARGQQDGPISTPSVMGSGEPAPDPMRNRPVPDHPGAHDPDGVAIYREASDREMQHARPDAPDRVVHDSPTTPRIPRLMSTSPDGRPPEKAGWSLWMTIAGILVVLLLLMLIV